MHLYLLNHFMHRMAKASDETPTQVYSTKPEFEGKIEESIPSCERENASTSGPAPDDGNEDTLPSIERDASSEADESQTEEAETESEGEYCNDMEADILEDLERLKGKGKKRRSFRRETKLAIIQYCHNSRGNKYKTAKEFGITCSTLRGWLKNEARIRSSSSGIRKIGCGRHSFWPDMEKELYRQYRDAKEKGMIMELSWFKEKSKELMTMMHPDVDFKSTSTWLNSFKQRTFTTTARQQTQSTHDALQDLPQAKEESDEHVVCLEGTRSPSSHTCQQETEVSETPSEAVLPPTVSGGNEDV